MNQCLHTGIYPSQLKLSRVKPLFKKGNKTHFKNYRPISLLPSLSKNFEYVIFDQLLHYLIEKKLLRMEQYGFRPGHSTELAAVRLVDHLISQIDNYSIPINVYIDLSKAFDTLNHNIHLSKLQYYGITGCSIDLLCSYLSGRSQFVECNGSKSEELPIDTGVRININMQAIAALLHLILYDQCNRAAMACISRCYHHQFESGTVD